MARVTFAVRNPGRIHTWWRMIGRSVGGRSRLAEQKRDRRDRWRADRSAWRHRAEARRVKAGRSVSQLSDAIMPLATIVRNASVAPRHTSLAIVCNFAFRTYGPSRESVVRVSEKNDDRLERNAETRILWTLLCIYLNCPVSINQVRPGNDPTSVWRSEKVENGMLCSRWSSRLPHANPMENVWSIEEKALRKVCVYVCLCRSADEFERFGDFYFKIAPNPS